MLEDTCGLASAIRGGSMAVDTSDVLVSEGVDEPRDISKLLEMRSKDDVAVSEPRGRCKLLEMRLKDFLKGILMFFNSFGFG